MELATGKVRSEFSGPSYESWAAAFLPDGTSFFAGRLFQTGVRAWPTAAPDAEGERSPAPQGRPVEGVEGVVVGIEVARTGLAAFVLSDDRVVLHGPDRTPPALAAVPGEGPVSVRFTSDGRTLVALRGGRAFAWSLDPPAAAAPAPAGGERR